MKNNGRNLLLILMADAVSPACNGTGSAQDGLRPQASRKPIAVLLDNWNEIGRKLIAMAEDFPEDKYDFKPNPAQRSFAEQLLHAAGANYFFINPVKGVKPPIRRSETI